MKIIFFCERDADRNGSGHDLIKIEIPTGTTVEALRGAIPSDSTCSCCGGMMKAEMEHSCNHALSRDTPLTKEAKLDHMVRKLNELDAGNGHTQETLWEKYRKEKQDITEDFPSIHSFKKDSRAGMFKTKEQDLSQGESFFSAGHLWRPPTAFEQDILADNGDPFAEDEDTWGGKGFGDTPDFFEDEEGEMVVPDFFDDEEFGGLMSPKAQEMMEDPEVRQAVEEAFGVLAGITDAPDIDIAEEHQRINDKIAAGHMTLEEGEDHLAKIFDDGATPELAAEYRRVLELKRSGKMTLEEGEAALRDFYAKHPLAGMSDQEHSDFLNKATREEMSKGRKGFEGGEMIHEADLEYMREASRKSTPASPKPPEGHTGLVPTLHVKEEAPLTPEASDAPLEETTEATEPASQETPENE